MVDRIATHAQSQSLARELMRLQTDYAKGLTQQSSGLKSDTYQGIATSTQRLLSLESEYSRLTSQSEGAQMGLDRVNGMYNAVQSMIDMITTARTDISAAISGSGLDANNLQLSMQEAFEGFASNLNMQQGGRYLFGGGVTDTAPVNITDTDYVAPTVPSTADTEYYQGDSYIAKVQASESLTVSYGITADNPAFEKALRAYNIIVNNPSDEAALQEAYQLFDESFEALNDMQTTLSNQASRLDDQINQNADDLNLLDSLISDIKSVDLTEVTVKLKELETQLEVSYALATTLLQLKLSDYL